MATRSHATTKRAAEKPYNNLLSALQRPNSYLFRAIHRDPSLYPNPETFDPSRWLEPSFPTYREPLTIYPNLQSFSAFGFGRRICPGMHIAERSLYIMCARILWAAEVWKTEDIGDYDYTPRFNTQPEPFAFGCSERQDRRKVVEEYWKVASEAWRIPTS